MEFSILALPFLLLIFAILETAVAFTAELAVERAATHIGRAVRTGQVAKAGLSELALRQAVCKSIPLPIRCNDIAIDLRSYSSFADIGTTELVQNGTVDQGALRFQPGKAGEIMALRVFYNWPIHTDLVRKYLTGGDGSSRLIAATDIFKVEPFK